MAGSANPLALRDIQLRESCGESHGFAGSACLKLGSSYGGYLSASRQVGDILRVVEECMPEYEFKFFSRGTYRATHLCDLETDAVACERARSYLKDDPHYDLVEVRCGIRFMQRIGKPRLVD